MHCTSIYKHAATALQMLALGSVVASCGGTRCPRTMSAAATSGSGSGSVSPSPSAASGADGCRPLSGPRAAFEVVVLGSGGPRSAGRAGASYAVMIDGKLRMLVDMGPGSFVRLGEMHLEHDTLDTLLLTHLHIDHTGDFADIIKSRDLGYEGPASFRIFGPAGRGVYPSTSVFVDRLLGPNGAFAYLRGFRNELRLTTTDLAIDQAAPAKELLSQGTTRVSTIPVDHGDTPAVAYRVEHGGRSVVFTGDLASKNDNVVRLAAGADILVYDTAVLDPPGSPANLYELHTSPKRIGEVAAAAKVHRLVLSHIPPNVEKDTPPVLASVRASYGGPVDVASDCMVLVPGGPAASR